MFLGFIYLFGFCPVFLRLWWNNICFFFVKHNYALKKEKAQTYFNEKQSLWFHENHICAFSKRKIKTPNMHAWEAHMCFPKKNIVVLLVKGKTTVYVFTRSTTCSFARSTFVLLTETNMWLDEKQIGASQANTIFLPFWAVFLAKANLCLHEKQICGCCESTVSFPMSTAVLV